MKQLLKLLAISKELLVVTPVTERVLEMSDKKYLKLLYFLSPLKYFLYYSSFPISSKYLLRYLCLLCLIRVDNKFLWSLYFSRSSSFLSRFFILIYLVNILFLMETDFGKPGVNQGLVFNFNLYLPTFFKGSNEVNG